MAALLALDSDDHEFGYDFSFEDEAALLKLSEAAPQPAAIDAVPVKAESVAGGDDVGNLSAFESERTGLRGSGCGNTIAPETTLRAAKPSSVAAATALPEDVSYPDCELPILGRWLRLTDLQRLVRRALSEMDREPSGGTDSSPVTGPRVEADPFANDGRSPLQKFRTYPKKPFSVSDLTSGAWCELQYDYTLNLLPGGRRTRTAAMKGGTKIHQKLEDEVHTTVKIDVLTKEDGFALRLWNFVQGLRTLRDTGLTRELEVWGTVDGNIVSGIIDSVSHNSPNPEFEQELSSQESQAQLDPKQSKLWQFFSSNKKGQKGPTAPKVYLSDVKTRGSTAPITKSLVRPAKIQLMLYHRFLSNMAAGKLDFLKVMRRYGLEVDDPFSDTFIAQIGSLHDEIFVDAASSSATQSTSTLSQQTVGDSALSSSAGSAAPDLVKYSSLRELVTLVQEEIAASFPEKELSVGPMLHVQYVHRTDGRQLDLHDFPVHDAALQQYLDRYMQWWYGKRPANGVDIEEAFKCRTCEHASICTWREDLDEQLVKKAKQKKAANARQPSK